MKHFFHLIKHFDLDQVSEILSSLVPKKGKSKAAVARQLGISSQLLGQYMDGRHKPKPDFYKAWKKSFGEDLLKLIETNVSHETIEIHSEVGLELGQIHEQLIFLKASANIFIMTLAELMAAKNKSSVANESLDLAKTISREVDRLFDELRKK